MTVKGAGAKAGLETKPEQGQGKEQQRGARDCEKKVAEVEGSKGQGCIQRQVAVGGKLE